MILYKNNEEIFIGALQLSKTIYMGNKWKENKGDEYLKLKQIIPYNFNISSKKLNCIRYITCL